MILSWSCLKTKIERAAAASEATMAKLEEEVVLVEKVFQGTGAQSANFETAR